MQREKGKRFEKLIADLIRSRLHAFCCRNMEQVGEDAGRDLWTSLPFCIQCSHSKAPSIWQKFREAKESAQGHEFPVAIVRRNYGPILVTMELDGWIDLVAQAFAGKRGQP